MKRLIIAGILLVLVVATYITSLKYITTSCKETKTLLNSAVEVYKQNQTAEAEAKEMSEFWDKKERILSAFVEHDRIDDIEQAISHLNIYAKEEDNVLFYEYADTVSVLLHQIMEDTKITTHSIF